MVDESFALNCGPTRKEKFQKILRTTPADADIDELRETFVAAGYWEGTSLAAKAVRQAMDTEIRRMIRLRCWTKEDGSPDLRYNVVRRSGKDGTPSHRWVQLELMTFDDRAQVIQDRLDKRDYFSEEALFLFDDSVRVFGMEFEDMFRHAFPGRRRKKRA